MFIPYSPALEVLLALGALHANDDVRLAVAPAPGATLATTIELELVLSGGALEAELGGEPVQASYLPAIEIELTDRRALAVVDAHDAEGWTRRYDELAWTDVGSMSLGDAPAFPWESEGVSPLAGRAVRFEREEGEARASARAFADGRPGDDALLGGLAADLGLAALLADRPLAVGGAWTVGAGALAALLEPGGELAWELPPEMAEHMDPDVRSLEHHGELELVLASLSEGVARCSVRGELERVTVQAGDLSQVPVVDGTATDTVTETWEIEGELAWHVAEARAISLDLAGPYRHVTLTEKDPGQPGPTYAATFTMEGSQRLAVACEPVEEAAER